MLCWPGPVPAQNVHKVYIGPLLSTVWYAVPPCIPVLVEFLFQQLSVFLGLSLLLRGFSEFIQSVLVLLAAIQRTDGLHMRIALLHLAFFGACFSFVLCRIINGLGRVTRKFDTVFNSQCGNHRRGAATGAEDCDG